MAKLDRTAGVDRAGGAIAVLIASVQQQVLAGAKEHLARGRSRASVISSRGMVIRIEFWLLVACSIGLPALIVTRLIRATRLRRARLIALSFLLITLAGLDVAVLQRVMIIAKETSSLMDDAIFLSESSVALYLLPLLSAGLGVNLLSFAISQHLKLPDQEP